MSGSPVILVIQLMEIQFGIRVLTGLSFKVIIKKGIGSVYDIKKLACTTSLIDSYPQRIYSIMTDKVTATTET